jgi:hypothetical protein
MFDLRRFLRLATAEWVERRRGWAWFFGVLLILHFLYAAVALAGEHSYRDFTVDAQGVTFAVGMLLSAPVFAARYFQALSRPGAALLALMRPASTFEKWLLMVLVVCVAYPLAYHLAFYVCDVPATWLARARWSDELAHLVARTPADAESVRASRESLEKLDMGLFHIGANARGVAGQWLAFAFHILLLQGFAVAGVVLFKRAPFLKTLLAGFLVMLASILAATYFDSDPGQLLGYWSRTGLEAHALTPLQHRVFVGTWILVPGLLWLATWLGLREREVA